MNLIKSIGIIALVLGSSVLLVASYLSYDHQQFLLEPFILGIAAICAGLLCIKKAQEVRE